MAISGALIIDECLHHLNEGKLILYPSDTIWGIGCDPFNAVALDNIFTIKKRPKDKSFILLVNSIELLENYVDDLSNEIKLFLAEYNTPTTVIYYNPKNLPDFLLAEDGSIGIRVINHPLISPLIKKFERPIVSTSANVSGYPSPQSFSDIHEKIRFKVDYIVPSAFDTSTLIKPSRIIAYKGNGQIQTIRN